MHLKEIGFLACLFFLWGTFIGSVFCFYAFPFAALYTLIQIMIHPKTDGDEKDK